MIFNELTNHLFNLKVLTTLNVYKNTISEYLDSIKESKMLVTEAELMHQNHSLTTKQIQQIIDKSGEASFDTFKDETETKIINLLKEIEIKEPLFGSIEIELKHIIKSINKSQELNDFIFVKDIIRNLQKNIKSKNEILNEYMELKRLQLGENFIEYLRLLEHIKTPLNISLEHLKIELDQTLKNKTQEEKITHIRALNNRNDDQLNKHSYLVVNDVLKCNYTNEIELANFLYVFTKSNSINLQELINLNYFFTTLFFDAYIKNSYSSYLETILVNNDEIFAFLQDRNSLNEYVLSGYILKFEEKEKQLIKEEYFDSSAKWQKEKKQMVTFILHCHSIGYFKIRATTTDNKELNRLRRFFEARYSINIEKQFQPKQRESIEVPSREFRWIENPY